MASDIQQFDFNVNLLRAVLWQYNDADHLLSLINKKKAYYDANQMQFWTDWVVNVFDLRTADEFGLQVWSIILGQSLYTAFAPIPPANAFGFSSNHKNFDNGNFGSVTGGNNVYSKPTARLLLRLRYFQLTSAGTVPEINRMLKYLFADDYGAAWLVDNHDMTQSYMFDFTIPSEIRYMLDTTGVLPRAAGVKSEIIEL